MTKVLSVTWQRCRVRFMRNVLVHAGKSGRRVVSAHRHRLRAGETPKAASAQWRAVADQIRPEGAEAGGQRWQIDVDTELGGQRFAVAIISGNAGDRAPDMRVFHAADYVRNIAVDSADYARAFFE